MDFSLDTLLMPFRFGFMLNAFYISLLVAVPAAMLSCFLVLKGWALMGDAVSHAVLPGIVLAYSLGWPLIIGAFIAGMTCALAAGYLSHNSRVKPDTVMGVVFSGMFGIGIVLYVSIETNAHLDHILFGNMLGVDSGELLTTGLISLAVSGAIVLKWRICCYMPLIRCRRRLGLRLHGCIMGCLRHCPSPSSPRSLPPG